MANQAWPHFDEPGETGPDYVALVIEWEDMEDEVTVVTARPMNKLPASSTLLSVVIGAGAIGALLLARWGIHRLRA